MTGMTGTDVIDLLHDRCVDLVFHANKGRQLTKGQFVALVARTFAEALPLFLEKLDATRPELAANLRAAFLREHEARMAARATRRRPTRVASAAPLGEPLVRPVRPSARDGAM